MTLSCRECRFAVSALSSSRIIEYGRRFSSSRTASFWPANVPHHMHHYSILRSHAEYGPQHWTLKSRRNLCGVVGTSGNLLLDKFGSSVSFQASVRPSFYFSLSFSSARFLIIPSDVAIAKQCRSYLRRTHACLRLFSSQSKSHSGLLKAHRVSPCCRSHARLSPYVHI